MSPAPTDPLNDLVRTINDARIVEPRKDREPWFYGFLDTYAGGLYWFGLFSFAAFSVVVILLVFYPNISATRLLTVTANLARNPSNASHATDEGSEAIVLLVRLALGLAVVAIAFLTYLVPLLLTVSSILLALDVGRNLRALRRRELDSRP